MQRIVMLSPSRIVHCCDAISWLEAQPVLKGASFVTSLPDVSEMHETHGHVSAATLAMWKAWFMAAAKLILDRCPDDGVAIFFQTDIKVEGTWVDKAYLIQRAAEGTSHALLWHKLVCRVAPGTATAGKPGYHHMLCFSRGVRAGVAKATADVLPEPGDKTWARGMGTAACMAACKYISNQTTSRIVVDPFCGHGTVLAVANTLGFNAIGVELSPKRARQAERLTVSGLKCVRGNSAGQQRSDGMSLQQQQQQQQQERQQQQQEQQERTMAEVLDGLTVQQQQH